MDRSFKSVLAVTFLVISLFLGTNVMVSKESNSSWLMWTLIFLAGAVLFWLWMMREEHSAGEDARDAAESARDRLDQLDAAAERIRARAAVHTPQVKVETPAPAVKAEPAPAAPAKAEPAPVVETKAPPAAAPAKAQPDDLTRVEGIGPKFAEILQAAGITTFAQLAAMSADQIVETIRSAGGRKSASMETWAEQAKLAAADDWEGLAKLQEKLSGGRK